MLQLRPTVLFQTLLQSAVVLLDGAGEGFLCVLPFRSSSSLSLNQLTPQYRHTAACVPPCAGSDKKIGYSLDRRNEEWLGSDRLGSAAQPPGPAPALRNAWIPPGDREQLHSVVLTDDEMTQNNVSTVVAPFTGPVATAGGRWWTTCLPGGRLGVVRGSASQPASQLSLAVFMLMSGQEKQYVFAV